MNQNPRDIAENIVESHQKHGPNFTLEDEHIETLARAYLSLEQANSETQSKLLELESRFASLDSELVSVKEENERLKNSCAKQAKIIAEYIADAHSELFKKLAQCEELERLKACAKPGGKNDNS